MSIKNGSIFLLSAVLAFGACSAGEPGADSQSGQIWPSDAATSDKFVEMAGLDGEPMLLAIAPGATWAAREPGYVELEAFGRQFSLSRHYEVDGVLLEVEGDGRFLASAEFSLGDLAQPDAKRDLFSADGALANADPLGMVDPMAVVLLLPENWRRIESALAGRPQTSTVTQALRRAQRPQFGGSVLRVSEGCVAACAGSCAAACIGVCVWNPFGSSCGECTDKCMDHCATSC